MPSKYKVTYFDGRGRAEPIRFLLSYLGEHFEDNRVSFENWPKLKPNTPFGKLPILEIDGKQYTQSVPLYRLLGRKAKLSGINDLEDLNIDIIADLLADLGSVAGQIRFEADADVKKAKTETFLNETLPFNLKKLEEIAENSGGFLANKKLSWADFMFASFAENMNFSFPESDLFKDYPTLQALENRILSFPKVKAYIAKRADTPF